MLFGAQSLLSADSCRDSRHVRVRSDVNEDELQLKRLGEPERDTDDRRRVR